MVCAVFKTRRVSEGQLAPRSRALTRRVVLAKDPNAAGPLARSTTQN